MRKLGVLEDPYLLKTRTGQDYWVRSSKGDRGVLKEYYEEGEYSEIDLSNYNSVVDVGAHIGVFTVESSLNTSQVVSFEPDPRNYEVLNKNIKQNGLENIKTENKAISNTKGEISLYLTPYSTSNSTVEKKGRETKVKSKKLRQILEYDLEKPRLLKLDCEGAEFPIILDSEKETLGHFDTIILEYHNTENTSHKDLINKLDVAGFSTRSSPTDTERGIIIAEKDEI